MSLRVKVRMSKIVRTPIKVDVCTYTRRTPVVDPCNARLNAIIKSAKSQILVDYNLYP